MITAYHQVTPLIESGKTTPSAYLEECLDLIVQREPVVKSFAFLDTDGARTAAAAATTRWAAGRPLSPIDGMPVGIKDLFETDGMPTEGNSAVFKGWVPKRDAAAVEALKALGAVIVGKTTTNELGGGKSTPTTNPHDSRRTPGGSSAGSAAAVGAGFIPAAVGSQLKGSILRPASFCGCVGFKPSFGAINRSGSITGPSSSSVVGALATTIEDAWLLTYGMSRTAGPDVGHQAIPHCNGLPESRPGRIGILRPQSWGKLPKELADGFSALTARLAADVTFSDSKTSPSLKALEEALLPMDRLHSQLCRFEGRWPLRSYIRKNLISEELTRLATSEDWMTVDDYENALRERLAMSPVFDRCFLDVDAILTLTVDTPAPLGLENTGDRSFQVPASFLGAPAYSLPLLTCESLPVGVQIIGRRQGDIALTGHARWLWAQINT